MSDYFLLDPDYKHFPEKQKLKFLTVYGEQHTFIVLAVIMCIVLPLTMYSMLMDVLLPDIAYLFGGMTQAVVTTTCQDRNGDFTYAFDTKDIWGNIQHYVGQDHGPTDSQPCPNVGDSIEILYIQGHPQTSEDRKEWAQCFS